MARKTPQVARQSAQEAPGARFGAYLKDNWAGLAALFVLVLATRALWFGDPVADYDEQLYSYIGWRMQFGELPYADWWDRKPFGLFAIFGLAHALMGGGALAFQLFGAIAAFAAGWLTYACARLIAGRIAATFAGAFTVILLAAYGSYSGQSEVFFTPLLLAMLRLVAERDHPAFTRRAMLAMLLGGLALQVKYTVIPQCLFFGLYALWVEHSRGRSLVQLARLAAAYALLGLAPTMLVALLYLAVGEFEAFWFANFISFFDRIPAQQGRWQDGYRILVGPVAILVLGGIYGAFRMTAPRVWSIWWLYLGFVAACTASVFLPSTVYGYYFAGLAAAAALAAVPMFDGKAVLRIAFSALLLGAYLYILNIPARYAQSQEERAQAQAFAAAIAPHVGAQDNCLWLFDGPTALYRLTGACVPTRYVYPDHMNNALETQALGVNQTGEVARILATKPGVIVTASRAVTPQNRDATALVKAELEASYEVVAEATMHKRKLIAWARRE